MPPQIFGHRRGDGVAHRLIAVVIPARQNKPFRRSHKARSFPHRQKSRTDFPLPFQNQQLTAAALEDMLALDYSTRQRVADGIKRASFNPLPKGEGGYGKPLGHKRGLNLTSLLEIKFRGMGIRAVYELI